MTLELHNVTLAGMPQKLSVMVSEGQMVSVNGQPGTGKTALVRAIMGFLPVSSGHICIENCSRPTRHLISGRIVLPTSLSC